MLHVRRRLESCSSSFQTSSKCIHFLIRTGLASHSNVFGFSFECISYNDQTLSDCGVDSFIHGANVFGQKTRYTLCLTGTVYDIPALIDLIISSFSSIVNTTFLRLNFSATLRTSLKFYSIDNVTTAHAQSNLGFVQMNEVVLYYSKNCPMSYA